MEEAGPPSLGKSPFFIFSNLNVRKDSEIKQKQKQTGRSRGKSPASEHILENSLWSLNRIWKGR